MARGRARPRRELLGRGRRDAANPFLVGGLMGGMLVFVFAGLCCLAVGKCASDVVEEARRDLPVTSA